MCHAGRMSRVEGIRARNRAAIEAEILRLAGDHLARYGAAGLSLRAIARDLGMASSAVYRYVPSRDELLTRLIIAAYDDLADAVEAALVAAPEAEPAERFAVIAHTTHAWARAHPHEYALIYGSPVPDYEAPGERTTPAGTRVPILLIGTISGLHDRHRDGERDARLLASMLEDPVFADSGLSPSAVRRGMVAWTLVIGAISAEIFEQWGPDTISDPDDFFAVVVASATHLVTSTGAP